MPEKVASAPGTTISDCAKMIGITPAVLIRSGMKFFDASRIRLRPVIMTAFSAVMGSVPLILAHGPGSASRQALGVVIFSGVSLDFTADMTPTITVGFEGVQWIVNEGLLTTENTPLELTPMRSQDGRRNARPA